MKIIIHAGWHKTGSTAIQWFLNENRERLLHAAGILYPETGLLTVAHHLVAWSLHDPMESAWADSIGFSEAAESLLPKVLQEAVAAGAKTCLLSSEEFAWWGKISPQRLAEIFSGHEVELVVYLRRQDQLAESFWAQGLKQGARMPDFQVFLQSIRNWFDFSEFCQWWEKSFPDSINVRIFNRSEFPDGDVVKDFSRFLGLTWDQNWKVAATDLNLSISAHSTRAIFEWNASNPAPSDELQQQRLVNFLRAIDSAEADNSQSLFRFPQRAKFLEGFNLSNQALFKKWCNRHDNPFALSESEIQRFQDEDAAETEEERFDAVQIRLRALTLRKENVNVPAGEQGADLLRNDGVHYLNAGMWRKALHRFAAAYALRPSGLFIRLSLARVLVELGRFSAAKGHLEALAQGDDFSGKEPLLGNLLKRCETGYYEGTVVDFKRSNHGTSNFKVPFIFGLNETIDESPFLTTESLFDLAGQNIGNLAFHHAISKLLGGGVKAFRWETSPDLLNKYGDIGIIPCANQLGSYADFGELNKRVADLKVPLVAIGLGAQSDAQYSIPKVPDGTLNWVREMSRHAPTDGPNIALRGPFTLEVLKNYGLDSKATVLGCPTLLINPDPDLGQRIAAKVKTPVGRVAVTAGHMAWMRFSGLESSLTQIMEATDGVYIVQAPLELVKAARGEAHLLTEEALVSLRDYTCPGMDLNKFVIWTRRYCRAFFNVPAWIEYLRGFDFVVGLRFHGVMLGIQAGVPSLCIAHDSRTREMCETTKVPYVMAEEVKDGITLTDLTRLFRFDPDEFDTNRAQMAMAYEQFLRGNHLVPADYLQNFASKKFNG